jgi:SpoVK/Ycf46/Vps4 family AAA+-type ATPase
MTMYDPITHHAIEPEAATSSVIAPKAEDRRWVRITRPVVMVGGELTLDMLDLVFNPISKFYEAPIQLKANGGVFLVDDFGRQRNRPQDLLNRWIVPLESRIDFLTLHTGKKFQVPFDVLVIFATNLDPADLVDEAFLRRTKHKVRAGGPTEQEFAQIFENCCRDQGVPFDPALVGELIVGELRRRGIELRGCYPRDLIEHALLLAEYHGWPRALTGELLSAACATYFVEDVRRNQASNCQT